MKNKVYTLTGDAGTTSLVSGTRVNKADDRVETYGTVDELNSHIGLLAAQPLIADMPELLQLLLRVQNKLFNLGAYLANDSEQATLYGVSDDDVTKLENAIDRMDEELPPMRGFILPGGLSAAALADVCRTVTRRAERRVVALATQASIDATALRFLNRLSDFFFVLSRYINVSNQVEEVLWQKD